MSEQPTIVGVPCECPKCHAEFLVHPSLSVPKEQVFYLELESESMLIPADIIGQQITSMNKLLAAVAKDVGGKVGVFMHSIVLEPHKVRLGFLIVDALAKMRPPKKS